MENIIVFGVGILLLVLAFLIGVRGQIGLVHSYHYKRVAEDDKPAFCKGVGVGNALVGLGVLISPAINAYAPQAAVWVMGVFVTVGLVVCIGTILVLNKGLF